jgi:hypothetical protein
MSWVPTTANRTTGSAIIFKSVRCRKIKSIPATGHGGLQGCEMSKIPHCIDNLLTDGG